MTRQFRVRFIAALLAMQAVTVVAIIVGGILLTRPALVDQMSRLMDSAAHSAAAQVSTRLTTQRQLAEQSADLISQGTVSFDDDVQLEQLFRTDVALDSDTTAVYLGRADGSFVYVGRDETRPGSVTRSWIIEVDDAGARRVVETWRDADGEVVAVEEDPTDTYDPRVRPWYTDAEAMGTSVWTDPYVFATFRTPGVTAAAPVLQDGALTGVVGVDLGLEELSTVVGEVTATENGSAMLVTADGTVIAHPDPEQTVQETADGARNRTADELDDPVAAAGYRSLRSGGDLDTSTTSTTEPTNPAGPPADAAELSVAFEVDGEMYRGVAVGLDDPTDWFVGITAPETDVVGEIVSAEQKTALIAVVVGLAVVVLAMPLVRMVSRRVGRLQHRAEVDALTGLVNRHVFDDALAREVQRAERSDGGRALCAAQIDVDYFKHVNDTYGHAAGDQALTAVAKRLAHGVRERDVVARLGGDEFGVLLIDTDEAEASQVMERIRATIESEPVETVDGTLVPITITVGIAQLGADGDGETGSDGSVGEHLMSLADEGLYVAKEAGRNKVATRARVCSGGPTPAGSGR